MATVAQAPLREDFLNFFKEQVLILHKQPRLKEPDSPTLVPNIRKISEALDEAKELSKQAESISDHKSVSKRISIKISKTLPNTLILTILNAYCEARSTILIQIGREQRRRVRRESGLVFLSLIAGFVCIVLGSLFSLGSYQISSIVVLFCSGLCEIVSIMLLKRSLSQRKNISRTIEKQDLLNRIKVSQLLIEQITNEQERENMLKNLLSVILMQE